MARRSFYSTRRQCRCCQEVVVGDAEDVPSSMIAVEVEGLEKLVVVPVQVTFHVCQVPNANNSTTFVPGPWSLYMVHARLVTVMKRVTRASLNRHSPSR